MLLVRFFRTSLHAWSINSRWGSISVSDSIVPNFYIVQVRLLSSDGLYGCVYGDVSWEEHIIRVVCICVDALLAGLQESLRALTDIPNSRSNIVLDLSLSFLECAQTHAIARVGR